MKLTKTKNSILLLITSMYLFGDIFIISLFSQSNYSGSAGAFLRIGMGVKPLSMGGAFTAVANDATASYWNPAGLNQIKNVEIFGMYSIMSMNREYNNIAFASPVGRIGTIGFNWINFAVANIIGRDQYGGITDILSDSENSFNVSFGCSIGSSIYLGGSLKYLKSTLASYDASGYSYDFGLLFRISRAIFIGATFQDINAWLKWNTASGIKEKIPMNNRIGISFRPPYSSITLAIDYEKSNNEYEYLHGGAEIKFSKNIGIDIGYCNNSFTGGGFLSLPFSEKSNLEFHYTLYDDKIDTPINHRLAIMLKILSGKKSYIKNPKYGNKLDEFAQIFNNDYDGEILKVVNEIYGLVDIGQNDGVYNGMILNLYRKKKIGEVRVLKSRENDSAIKLIKIDTSLNLSVGDKIGK